MFREIIGSSVLNLCPPSIALLCAHGNVALHANTTSCLAWCTARLMKGPKANLSFPIHLKLMISNQRSHDAVSVQVLKEQHRERAEDARLNGIAATRDHEGISLCIGPGIDQHCVRRARNLCPCHVIDTASACECAYDQHGAKCCPAVKSPAPSPPSPQPTHTHTYARTCHTHTDTHNTASRHNPPSVYTEHKQF